MQLPIDLPQYISQYGYLAIFIFIFLQEVGAPNPIPNEFVLLFSGYLVFAHAFYWPLLLIVVVLADFSAAFTLYTIFYFFGNYLLNKKHRWFPISAETIHKQSKRIEEKGWPGITIGRLTPFIRGYVAVICGLLQLQPKKYGLTILCTSSIWAIFYTTCGYFLGPYWQIVLSDMKLIKMVLGGMMVLVLCIFFTKLFIKISLKKKMDRSL